MCPAATPAGCGDVIASKGGGDFLGNHRYVSCSCRLGAMEMCSRRRNAGSGEVQIG